MSDDRRLDAAGVMIAVRGLDARPGEFVVVGGAAMAMRGLRLAHNVDLLVSSAFWDHLSSTGWKLRYWDPPAGQVKKLCGPDGMEAYRDLTVPGMPCTFEMVYSRAERVQGVPVEPMSILAAWKRAYNRPIDMADVRLIDTWVNTR